MCLPATGLVQFGEVNYLAWVTVVLRNYMHHCTPQLWHVTWHFYHNTQSHQMIYCLLSQVHTRISLVYNVQLHQHHIRQNNFLLCTSNHSCGGDGVGGVFRQVFHCNLHCGFAQYRYIGAISSTQLQAGWSQLIIVASHIFQTDLFITQLEALLQYPPDH